jgi:hypothetical protein
LVFLGISFLSLDFEFWLLLIEFHELCKIELWLLKELNLSDENVLKWEDFATFLLNLFAN